jgi:luciferase family oxidoreductase group 1
LEERLARLPSLAVLSAATGTLDVVPLSILDLSPVAAGSSGAQSLRNSLDLARLADGLGYTRYWVAEHHNLPSIASSAPDIMIGQIAAATAGMRVGSGGVMLPNHAPLMVAERFKVLEALFPGRIDLGLGRAPGTDPVTSYALRRRQDGGGDDDFLQRFQELVLFENNAFPENHPFRSIRAMPEDVALPPIWLLGSSGYSAQLAAMVGAGYSFAHHFADHDPVSAMLSYRAQFKPRAALASEASGQRGDSIVRAHSASEDIRAETPVFAGLCRERAGDTRPEPGSSARAARETPYAILACAAVCADSDAEAERLASTIDLNFVRRRQGQYLPLASPEEAAAYPYSPAERALIARNRARLFVGGKATVLERLRPMIAATKADEVMVTTMLYDHAARRRSYELLAEAFELRT